MCREGADTDSVADEDVVDRVERRDPAFAWPGRNQAAADGRRRVVSISEITGMEGEVISMQELVTGMRFTGVRPQCLEKIQRASGGGS